MFEVRCRMTCDEEGCEEEIECWVESNLQSGVFVMREEDVTSVLDEIEESIGKHSARPLRSALLRTCPDHRE